ncbi:Protein LURP-one-related like [Melia azedarach]|uniref:Protein LURP-one-related like n=1 Tax=Melia azedarach TaxID=155640 RepID=A0ACC1Y7G8_MELAZ|nr:Protein LURP-one-related like [Melia azedarach]
MATADADSAPIYTANSAIPVDLFVSKNFIHLTHGDIRFTDSDGKIVYRVNRRLHKRIILDSAGNPLIYICRGDDKGSWQGFKGNHSQEKDLIFSVKRTVKTLTRTEFEVLLVGEISGGSASDFMVKGCPFQRSCTIYRGDSLVAQTSLMYKLGQIYVRRDKFRLTIFPGSVEPALIVALVVIFLD